MRPLVALLLIACAQTGFPPGGPVDEDPPKIIRVRPDTNAVNVRSGGVTFDFDEVISERPQGATDLAGLFLVSPSRGDPRVSWRRTSLGVSPRGGLRPNTTYVLTMLPGLTDLEGNVDSTERTLVFSTGPTIAQGKIRGIVFDWLAERSAPRALIEAYSLPDSTRYVTVADSSGRFDLGHVPPGRYLLRTIIDQNKNRLLDPRELFDSATIVLADSARREMLAFVHDSLGPGIARVDIVDSLTLRVGLDRALDTALVVVPALFTLKRADSTVVVIQTALSTKEFDKARDDSLKAKAARDSVIAAARADSIRRADTTAARTPPRVLGRRPDSLRAAPRPAAGDSAKEPPPKPSVRTPVNEIVLTLATPLQPATSYRLRAVGLRSLLGRERTSDRVFLVPKPRAVDSTRKDTTVRDTVVRDTSETGDGRRETGVRGIAARRGADWVVARAGVFVSRPRRVGSR